jgi:hypothetical protein
MYQTAADQEAAERKRLAVTETTEEQLARLKEVRLDDPIAYQDAKVTSAAFLEAAKDEDFEELKRIVKDAYPEELLHQPVALAFLIAVRRVDLQFVEFFIEQGLTGHWPGVSIAFHVLVESTEKENFAAAVGILQLLKKNDWDIDEPRQSDGFTPLSIACARAHAPLAYVLVQHGAHVNVSARRGETPLRIVQTERDDDDETQREARPLIANMLSSYGAKLKITH